MARRARVWFLVLLAAALALLGRVLLPLVVPVLLGAIVAVLTWPLHRALARRTRRPTLAALLAAALSFAGLVVPVGALGALALREALSTLPALGRALATLDPRALAAGLLHGRGAAERLTQRLVEGLPDAAHLAQVSAQWLATHAGPAVGGAATAAAAGLAQGFLLLVSVFYFYRDGAGLLARGARLLPIGEAHARELFSELRGTITAVIGGTLVVGALQAAAMLAAFWAAGVAHPALWAAVGGVASVVPLVGSALVWAPAGLLLVATGHAAAGAAVLGSCGLVAASTENVLRPLLVRGRLRLHPLLVFLSIFGGLASFGPPGLVLGPLAASLCAALVRIWERDFAERPPAPAARAAGPGALALGEPRREPA